MQGQQPTRPSRPENVIPFGTYHTAMTQPILAQIRTYWEDLRAGRLMPLRSEVDPRDMSSFLEQCFVLERPADGDPRFRLAGMAINDVMGMEVRGMPVQCLIMPGGRRRFSAKIGGVFETPEIQEYKLVSDPAYATTLTGNLLVLPLKGDNGRVDRAIGCLSFDGAIGLPPRRFRMVELKRTSLVTGLTEIDGAADTDMPVMGFAEEQAPFVSEGETPYLRVVK